MEASILHGSGLESDTYAVVGNERGKILLLVVGNGGEQFRLLMCNFTPVSWAATTHHTTDSKFVCPDRILVTLTPR
jgi:hypothetical protein